MSWTIGLWVVIDCSTYIGLNYLCNLILVRWQIQKYGWQLLVRVSSLSVGIGTIHCYSSYLKQKMICPQCDVAGWMNGFVEIVLGSAVVIPTAVGIWVWIG